ncbi:metallophosphoesterase family protein [Hyphomicrobium facile]|uniref:DNA repair exonuclease SbcCD nuclease subunit n=1 Tax=Hyphomicrobium facile TaxID=51670 RepID=A0A1I7N0F5_9HYPH|nr:metallophosphoesterase [Hyphomicrobium facile]SFV28142.1 DNA repair exonuclease SbcCD nuclease subunit [Hyphomicrobium facile]
MKLTDEAAKARAMTFRFIHSSDWHLAKPFRRFEPGLAGELAAARLGIIGRLAKIARERGARHVLVAGDIFDSELIATLEIRRALAQLAEESDVTWLLLPGNHDPLRLSGVWDQVSRLGLPPNVSVLSSATPHTLAGNAVLLPSPVTSKDPGRDVTEWMDAAQTPPGAARIGLAHGSVRGFGSDDDAALRLAPDRAKRAGLAYLALGDWHGAARVSAETWYSGTPEPDQFPDNEPGFALSVTVDGAQLVAVDKVPTAEFTWLKFDRTVHSAADFGAIERDVRSAASTLGKTLLRLALGGHLSLADRAALDVWREEWSARLRRFEIDDKALTVTSGSMDFESLGLAGALLDAARHLAAVSSDPASPERDAAATALLRLAGFAAEGRREAGQ